MIDIFFMMPARSEYMHPRVCVTTAPDAERAQTMIEAMTGHGIRAGGRPSRRRGTVAQLIARRDAALGRGRAPAPLLVAVPDELAARRKR